MIDIKVLDEMKKAVSKGDCAKAQSLLEQHPGLHLETAPTNDTSWLHMAVQGNSIDMVHLLLKFDTPVDILSNDYQTPLYRAASTSHDGLFVELLLKQGANPNGHPRNITSPLHCAVMNHFGAPSITLLIAHGASVETRDKQNRTPLMMAAWEGNIDALQLLLGAGANLSAKGGLNSDDTAIDFAIKGDEPKAEEFLKRYTQATLASRAIDEVVDLTISGRVRSL